MVSGIVSINIKYTSALSPLGNTNENYELVSEEFGEDFSNFIKDNSYLKIYKEDSDILLRIGENNFRITNESNLFKELDILINKVKGKSGYIEDN